MKTFKMLVLATIALVFAFGTTGCFTKTTRDRTADKDHIETLKIGFNFLGDFAGAEEGGGSGSFSTGPHNQGYSGGGATTVNISGGNNQIVPANGTVAPANAVSTVVQGHTRTTTTQVYTGDQPASYFGQQQVQTYTVPGAVPQWNTFLEVRPPPVNYNSYRTPPGSNGGGTVIINGPPGSGPPARGGSSGPRPPGSHP